MPKLVCCIVTLNHSATIRKAIEQTSTEVRRAEGEIWLRDNGSTDGTQAILKGLPEISFLELGQENLGFCRGNNQLLNRALSAGARFILFLNPDCAPASGAISSMISAAEVD